ncbi:MAG: DsbA family protein [Candidatus Thermoplasmatota archaeon]|nr:DsbA family protein [Candidatus Thermoplasmatota archaeon]
MSPDASTPTVHVFFDYVCPYAYIGKLRADEIERQYDVNVRFLPWEIYPNAVPTGETMDWDPPEAYTSWVESLAEEVGAELNGPEMAINANLALRGFLYAGDQGEEIQRAYHDAVFEAVWTQGRNIGDEDVLAEIVAGIDGLDPESFLAGIRHHSYQYRLDLIDQLAEEELGIQRVPTFVFGDQRIVGNDRFEPSLRSPLEAYLERRKHVGEDWASTLDHDTGLGHLDV